MSADPIGLAGGMNVYEFGGSDPVNRYDPTGLTCWLIEERIEDASGDYIRVGWQPVGLVCDGLAGAGWLNPASLGSDPRTDPILGSGQRHQCSRGFALRDCAVMLQAIQGLVDDGRPLCRALGANAAARWQARLYIYVGQGSFEGEALDFGRVRRGELDPSRGRIAITASGVALAWPTVVHEEYHYLYPSAAHGRVGGPDSGTVLWGQANCGRSNV